MMPEKGSSVNGADRKKAEPARPFTAHGFRPRKGSAGNGEILLRISRFGMESRIARHCGTAPQPGESEAGFPARIRSSSRS